MASGVTDVAGAVRTGYTFSTPALTLGPLVVDGRPDPSAMVRVPLAMMNRHGLVAGATGTGKTKTLQVLAEQLSRAGVPVFLADIKGDVSGMAVPGQPSDKLAARTAEIGQDWQPTAFPCEFYALGGKGPGIPRGVVSIMELPGVVEQPALFSSFLMWLLADLFQDLPEVGDVEKPKLVFFFDEAHLLFKDASKEFIGSITQTVRLIRSKGVGVFFVTQTPKDVHPDVLAQLGNRIQHALRAYTPDDAKALKATASTFPNSGYEMLAARHASPGTPEAAAAPPTLPMAVPPVPKRAPKGPPPEPGMAERILGSTVAKSMLRAGATAAAGAIVRSIFGTSRKR